MKRLFNDDDSWLTDANSIEDDIAKICYKILSKYDQYSIRDIQSIAHQELEIVIRSLVKENQSLQ